MKRIYKIAKAELATLFYSPIAWLILVVFAFQTGMRFMELFQGIVKYQYTVNGGYPAISFNIFSGNLGLFATVQNCLYLYIPLLTMGLMSREYSSGSIKLLYSSPIKASHIIYGKYLAMMTYGLILCGVLMTYVVCCAFTVENFDLSAVMSGMLAIYLLICAYSAIGLYMSSLTSYQVVAAIGTLVLLAVLNYINKVGQDIQFMREITYWLSISGRCNEMISGLVCSEDVLYFIIVSLMFLLMSILKLQSSQTHISIYAVAAKYGAVVAGAMLLGYLTSRPAFMSYYDATETKRNTLTPNSQEIMSKLDGGLTITTYVNLLDREYYHAVPKSVKNDMERFKQYIRFKPETKMKYVYYYDKPSNNPWVETRFPNMSLEEQAKGVAELRELKFNLFLPPEKLKENIDLTDEGNTFVRLVERENGQKAFLRIYNDMMKFPGEAEISAVFKRMVMKLPRVAFLQGHGERSIEGDRMKDYTMFASVKTFRNALTNQGCDVEMLNLSGDAQIPEEVDIIVISDMKQELLPEEKAKLEAYIAKGGNLLITVKPGQDAMSDFIAQFGVQKVPGMLVQPKIDCPANMVLCRFTDEAVAQSDIYNTLRERRQVISMTGGAGLTCSADKGYTVIPILQSDTMQTWNELQTIDFVNDSATIDTASGEYEDRFVTAVAASRQVGDKEQRIMILGDADCISNGGLTPAVRRFPIANFQLITGMFHWLSYNTVPVDVSRPRSTDNMAHVSKTGVSWMKVGFMGVLPLGLMLWGLCIWVRRKWK
ncbi:MAG: Gldg family protein [Dysgonamonadaceae bacterium]|jgi:ABC-2 type transport system permease protein|nr:Gldg family protein [Dysgonamonadaceae bacterium]